MWKKRTKQTHQQINGTPFQLVLLTLVFLVGKIATDEGSCDKSRRILTDTFGEIRHGPNGSNYTQDSHCEWMIKAGPRQFITLSFKMLHTECSYDYIFVYDGDSFHSPLLGSFSGKTEPQNIVAASGFMLILLYSDTNYVLDGFRAEYSITDCPNNCTDRGKCVDHKCVCQGNWISEDCSRDACPENCGASETHGICNNDHCECVKGFSGQSCSLAARNPIVNEWHWVSSQPSLAATATTAVYINETDSLYVFGGYNLNSILDSLYIFRFASNTWEDELGLPLKSSQANKKIDKNLLRAVLQQDDSEATQWGLKKKASFFGNFLLSALSEGNTSSLGHQQKSSSENLTFVEGVLDEILETIRPTARYGHASARVKTGFVIFGGKLASGNLSNELWYYNVSKISSHGLGVWSLRAMNSKVKPPPLTRMSLTLANDHLYLFGGSTETGEFSSRLFKIKLFDNETSTEQWEEVKIRGGKVLDVRVVAHTTNYHQPTNSLIVYGGIVAGVARFSKLSDRMFAFQLDQRQWTEIMYPRTSLRDAFVPRERAFHTTTLVGNYLIVFGGYTHRHNKEEICYDNQMYLYHLGCHSWINQDVLGSSLHSKRSRYPKRQGVFAHAADIRGGHTLLIFGGYHGNVNGDLLAYTLPAMLAVHEENVHDPESVCVQHISVNECLSNPECGWCAADGLCYGRTIGANCTTNLQTTRCPGICPALGDCHSCLIHGNSPGNYRSVASKLGLGLCSWCVQNARCHAANDRTICGEETPSQDPGSGWWGSKGTEIVKPEMCTELDRRPGLTFIKYFHPVNWSLPDHVIVVNATVVDFQFPPPATATTLADLMLNNGTEEMISRLIGFIRPPSQWADAGQMLRMCASYSQAALKLGVGSNLSQMQDAGNLTAEQYTCTQARWPRLQPNTKILVDFQARKFQKPGSNLYHHVHQSKMELQHNKSNENNAKAFTFEYLEPFSTSSDTNRGGDCRTYDNCLHCMTDAICGWCDLTNRCVSRLEVESEVCRIGNDWKYLTLQPSGCQNCSNFISCESCVATGLCEWWPEAKCARKNRSPNGTQEISKCPAPCHTRNSCSACLNEKGRCVWCEAVNQCFSFSIYTSEYQFGLCREWLDQPLPGGSQPLQEVLQPKQQQCKTCETHKNCTTCLKSLSCGWCYNQNNPIEGICMLGDFNKSFNNNCGAATNTSWAYAQCPDVDECALGLHDCHKEAECTNTHGSFTCKCRKGYIGDGHILCQRTCYETCEPHGHCEPDYQCKCDLGWTGRDCSSNCGCNNHSTCNEKGVGKCDVCQDWTEGEFCERCTSGAFGNATSSEIGCKPCECNGHGNASFGICDSQTGECYCQDNTEGLKCEMCNREYYGDPRDDGKCYFQCESRGILTNPNSQGFGSYQSYKPIWGDATETRECLWVVSAANMSSTTQLEDVVIKLEIEEDSMNITCGENALYVYEGLPDLTGAVSPQKQLLSVYCNEDSTPLIIDTRSGALTIHYKQGAVGQGFNAVYTVFSCAAGTCKPPYICNAGNKKCTCPEGFSGTMCELERCPSNCNAESGNGFCEKKYGRCVCNPEFGGSDCSQRIESYHLVFTELFNTQLLGDDSLEHLRKTLPRFGHSLVADRRGGLWMFGGYSMSHGPLNDIRQFDTKNNTWMQVTVDSSPNDKMPAGRYFHASDIVTAKQTVFVYGGLTTTSGKRGNKILDDFWSFSIQNQRWVEVELESVDVLQETLIKPPPLIGHSLTYVRDMEQNLDSLLLLGGFNREHLQHNSEMYEFVVAQKKWKIVSFVGQVKPINIFGHTSVFHQSSQVLYVYGGFLLQDGQMRISNKIFAFNYKAKRWTELPTWQRMNSPQQNLPRARYLHSAISTENYMLVFGGRTNPLNTSDVLIAYSYKCNQWIRLTQNIEIIGRLPTSSYAQALAQDPESGAVYVVGGWDGKFQSKVTRIKVPADLCHFWSFKKFACRYFYGCSYCSIKSESEDHSHCYSTGGDRGKVCEEGRFRGTLMSNEGLSCDSADELIMAARRCSDFISCRECLSVFPPTALSENPHDNTSTTPLCQWCKKTNKCRDSSVQCDNNNGGNGNDTTLITNTTQVHLDQCAGHSCQASDCNGCMALEGCSWAIINDDSSQFTCFPTELAEKSKSLNPGECPVYCYAHKNCSSCLSEGGNCHWSTHLNECLSAIYQSIYCAGGTCGLVLTPQEREFCPEPCGAYDACSTCLKHAHCGWCALADGDGEGICTEGSLQSPSEHSTSVSCAAIYLNRNRSVNKTELVAPKLTWNYVKCPPENECRNDHHDCDSVSQMCVDLFHGYECQCASGYKLESGECTPICLQGCVRGVCVKPNECSCDFGYVGSNCSIQCQCNGHAECAGPDRLDQCFECHNETMGPQCDKCRPLFVGDPKNSGECIPCSSYCHGHTDLCVAREMLPIAKNMSKVELMKYLLEGSVDDVVCLKCGNMTDGDRCESCITGNFRGTSTYTDVCRPCECHGHGDVCDPVTGEKCNCANNTESDSTCSAKYGKNASNFCWMSQCSKCKETYVGHPSNGHQCYKQITVESKMCFDAKSIDECKIKPQPLRPGQTVFFMVQPRFMNVDIRIVVDVTQGELDFFMSPQDDSFIVAADNQTAQQEIYLDTNYQWFKSFNDDSLSSDDIMELMHMNAMEPKFGSDNSFENITPSPLNADDRPQWPNDDNNCKTMNSRKFLVKDQFAKDLSTYITLHHCNTLLRVFGLKNRLVLTLPQNAHNLSGTRFFIVLKSNAAAAASYGLIFFRQDQLHIDLFVFFSVFFSCFFLFLAICVVAWKAKQASDMRRARRRHVVEMFNMAKRPFAKITLSFDNPTVETPMPNRKRKKSQEQQSNQVNTIALEPTADNCTAIRTVFVMLPGKYKAPVRLALGSAMILINRNNFSTMANGGRAFLRRRGSNHNQQHPQQIPLQIRG